MKKLYTLLTAVILTASAFAQAPEKMSYQAVVRNVGNALVTSQAVGMQLSILQGSITGSIVYVETQTPTTNINGLVSIEIGSGTVVSGTFNAIDWSNGPYFIKTETDPTGGTSYTITGTSQLMSVPYALHANTADSIVGGVSITETDPVFGTSIANGITAIDTANWNNHTVNTDTQLDSTDISNLGYVAGPHTVELDASTTNEIQDISLVGQDLSISSGSTIDLSALSPWTEVADTISTLKHVKIDPTFKLGKTLTVIGQDMPFYVKSISGADAEFMFKEYGETVWKYGSNEFARIDIGPGPAGFMELMSVGVTQVYLNTSGMSYFNGGNVGIGTATPASKLEVDNGDIEVVDSANGVILRSPNGTRYRITVDNAGNLTTSPI